MALVNRRTAAVCIYVMSYSQLRNEQDYEAFRDIFQRDNSKILYLYLPHVLVTSYHACSWHSISSVSYILLHLIVIFFSVLGVFEDGRMLIVITHFDMSYNQVDKELTEQEVKKIVISQISRVVPEVTVSKEIIVLVSGLWAYQVKCTRFKFL